MNWQDSVVLLTGGTGSFGHKFTEIMLRDFKPKKLIIFSRDELKQHEMRSHGFDHPSLRYFIGDVRDADRLRRATKGVDVIVHAAALKQVPACEYNPIEAVLTNVIGARNVIDAALDNEVKTVLALSTDKAVCPINLYGATKLVAEKLFIQANSYSGSGPTRFACIRYGNVVGSRGSVVPLFQEQRSTGTLTLTDARMTRFWITLDQGVKCVARCIEEMEGGEVFVPKIRSMRMTELAKAIGPECKLDVIGIRPGEKLHEMLLSEEESLRARDVEGMYVVKSASATWHSSRWQYGKELPKGFRYESNCDGDWLSADELKSMVSSYGG